MSVSCCSFEQERGTDQGIKQCAKNLFRFDEKAKLPIVPQSYQSQKVSHEDPLRAYRQWQEQNEARKKGRIEDINLATRNDRENAEQGRWVTLSELAEHTRRRLYDRQHSREELEVRSGVVTFNTLDYKTDQEISDLADLSPEETQAELEKFNRRLKT